jgi:hypothetical protein
LFPLIFAEKVAEFRRLFLVVGHRKEQRYLWISVVGCSQKALAFLCGKIFPLISAESDTEML